MEGTEYFSSQAIHCDRCSTRQHGDGTVTYSHTAVTPVLVHPESEKVIPLAPEFVRPQDGFEKQDGEIAAAKRWLAPYGAEWGPRKLTLLGDDLYCHEPYCRIVQSYGIDFIWVCKPTSHPTTYEWIDDLTRTGAVITQTRTRWTGQRHEMDTDRFVNRIPLRDANDALMINWCERVTTDTQGKILYHNAFATTFVLDSIIVIEVVKAGRSRWKIENENHNTLKTKGYHFEHHFGHGQQHLSALLASLIILAFFTHTVLDWMDDQYRLLRQKLPSRKRLFNDIRTLTSYLRLTAGMP